MRISEYTSLVEESLRAIDYPGGDLDGLYGPVAYGLSAGGKRLRPALLLMSAEAFGGEEGMKAAMQAAIGIEMFHNFTLLHDDVMDESDTRRGRPSVQAKWDVNTAILSGDTMLTLATRYISKVPEGQLRKVLDIFNDMALRVYEGQRLDMDFESRDNVTVSDYIRMIGFKTGALLGASAKIGALIGGAGEGEADAMYRYAFSIGLAFQIQDDWLDVYGDSATFGKPIGGDINNGKKSYLLLSGLACDRAESEALRVAMKMPSGETKVKTVKRIYDKLGLSEAVRRDVSAYTGEALSALRETGLSEEIREPFRVLADRLTGRKK